MRHWFIRSVRGLIEKINNQTGDDRITASAIKPEEDLNFVTAAEKAQIGADVIQTVEQVKSAVTGLTGDDRIAIDAFKETTTAKILTSTERTNLGNAILEGDSRLTDARTPLSHGNDAHSSTFVDTTDSRLTDARTPLSHGNDAHSSTFATTSDAFIKASDTLDNILDGTSYKRVSAAEKAEIEGKFGYLGEIRLFQQSTVPSNFLELDSSSISLTTYADLAETLGHTAVAVDGSYALDAGTEFTTDYATDNRLDAVGHGLVDNDIVKLSTSDTLPAGLANNVFYFVKKISDNEFELALTAGGDTIAISDNGTGTHKFHAEFTLADFRGEGLRGWDNGRGVDTDRVLGSYQAHLTEGLYARMNISVVPSDQIEYQRVTSTPTWTSSHKCDAGTASSASTSMSTGCTVSTTGVNETRMRNRAVVFAICWSGI